MCWEHHPRLSSRRGLTLAACGWPARTLQEDWGDRGSQLPIRFLIHDRDAKFTSSFDIVFASQGIERVLTPFRCPKANAFAERWVRTVREECLDHLPIISQAHLQRVLLEYLEYYNHRRPHQGIDQRIPVPQVPLVPVGSAGEKERVEGARPSRREVLGGIIHDYYWDDWDSH